MALVNSNWSWSDTDKYAGAAASDVVLSNASGAGFLKVTRNHNTGGNSNMPGRTVESFALAVGDTLELYAKVNSLSGGADGIGIGYMNSGSALNGGGIGNDGNSVGLYVDGSWGYGSSAGASGLGAFAVNDIMGIKLERTSSSLVIFTVNKNGGTWTAIPAITNVNGISAVSNFYGAQTTYYNGDQFTLQVAGGAAAIPAMGLYVGLG